MEGKKKKKKKKRKKEKKTIKKKRKKGKLLSATPLKPSTLKPNSSALASIHST